MHKVKLGREKSVNDEELDKKTKPKNQIVYFERKNIEIFWLPFPKENP